MILTGSQIRKACTAGDVTIYPFDEAQVNPNSYDYRLGPELVELVPAGSPGSGTRPTSGEPVPCSRQRRHDIGSDGFVLMPGRLYLGATYERIGSEAYVTTLIGKSSMGRLGLFLQVDACLGRQGVSHHWTLELCTRIPLRVYPRQRIGQVSFWTVNGVRRPYDGKYGRHDRPTPNAATTSPSEP